MKNIFDLYEDQTGLTTEGAVSADPIEIILAVANFEDATLTVEQALSYADSVTFTSNRIAQFEAEFAPVEAAIESGALTTENANQAVTAYSNLCTDLKFTPEKLAQLECTVLTTENSASYPESTAKLTKENATKLIETIKAKIVEIIKKIADTLKTVGVKIAAYALDSEDKAQKLIAHVNDGLTDKIIEGKEIEFEFVSNRMAIYGSLTKDNLSAMMTHANSATVAKNINDAITKDVAGKKFETIYTLPNDVANVKADLFNEKDAVTNVYALAIDGDTVSALVTRKGEGDKLTLTKETAKVTDTKGFKGNKPLSRKDIVSLGNELIAHAKKQKDLVKTITGYVTMPKVTEGDVGFLNQVPGILNTATASYIALAMSAATTNRAALAILADSSKLYIAREDKKDEKKEEEK